MGLLVKERRGWISFKIVCMFQGGSSTVGKKTHLKKKKNPENEVPLILMSLILCL